MDVQDRHPTSHVGGWDSEQALGGTAELPGLQLQGRCSGPGKPAPGTGARRPRRSAGPPPRQRAWSQACTDREAAGARLSRVLAEATAGRKAPSDGGAIARAQCRVLLAPGLVATCPVLVPRPEG